MRILLASPESGVWNSRKHIHMGLGYLAGALLAHGYEVDIWDAAVEEDTETLAEQEECEEIQSQNQTTYQAVQW